MIIAEKAEQKSLIGAQLPTALHHETSPHPVPVAYHVTNSAVLERNRAAAEWPSETDLSASCFVCWELGTEYIIYSRGLAG